jgi:hypothetical protein
MNKENILERSSSGFNIGFSSLGAQNRKWLDNVQIKNE